MLIRLQTFPYIAFSFRGFCPIEILNLICLNEVWFLYHTSKNEVCLNGTLNFCCTLEREVCTHMQDYWYCNIFCVLYIHLRVARQQPLYCNKLAKHASPVACHHQNQNQSPSSKLHIFPALDHRFKADNPLHLVSMISIYLRLRSEFGRRCETRQSFIEYTLDATFLETFRSCTSLLLDAGSFGGGKNSASELSSLETSSA